MTKETLCRVLLRHLLEPRQRVSRTADEERSQHLLDQLSTPAWRETEVSIEGDPTAPRLARRQDLNHLVIDDAERKMCVQRELPQRFHRKQF